MKVCLSEFTYKAFEELIDESFPGFDLLLIDSEANVVQGEGKPDIALVSYELMFKALKSEDFFDITKRIVDLANIHSRGRVISFLEGGYDLLALSESVKHHLLALKS